MSGFGTSAWALDPYCADGYPRTGDARKLDVVTAPMVRNGVEVKDSDGNHVQSSPTLERVLFALATKPETFRLVSGGSIGDGAINILVNSPTAASMLQDEVQRALAGELQTKRIKNLQVIPAPYAQDASTDVNQFMVSYEANDA